MRHPPPSPLVFPKRARQLSFEQLIRSLSRRRFRMHFDARSMRRISGEGYPRKEHQMFLVHNNSKTFGATHWTRQ